MISYRKGVSVQVAKLETEIPGKARPYGGLFSVYCFFFVFFGLQRSDTPNHNELPFATLVPIFQPNSNNLVESRLIRLMMLLINWLIFLSKPFKSF